MKRYINSRLCALLVTCGLQVNLVSEMMQVGPTEEGQYSIVNAIKQNSNLTQNDINRYKALQFGGLGTFAAFLLGAASSVGAGVRVYKMATPDVSQIIKNWTPEKLKGMEDWLSNPLVLAGVGLGSAGLLSYQLLNPSVREEIKNNILAKVQKYIDTCTAIAHNSQRYAVDKRIYNIFNWSFNNLNLLRSYLPTLWPHDDDVAVYAALYNLQEQGRRAKALLNYIKLPANAAIRNSVDDYYNTNLSDNLELYAQVIDQAKQQEIRDVELDIKKEQVQLMRTGRYALYGSMVKGAVSSMWNGIKELYAHPEILGLLGLGWVTTKYLVPSIKGVSQDTWTTLRSLKK